MQQSPPKAPIGGDCYVRYRMSFLSFINIVIFAY